MIGRLVAPVIDRTMALHQAGLLGYDVRVVALLLPFIESGLWTANGKIATQETEAEVRQE